MTSNQTDELSAAIANAKISGDFDVTATINAARAKLGSALTMLSDEKWGNRYREQIVRATQILANAMADFNEAHLEGVRVTGGQNPRYFEVPNS
jgi:hypothetical protein